MANPRPITVALYFRASDAPALWDLAARHWRDDTDDISNVSAFTKAARAAERGQPMVLECSVKAELDELAAFFPRHGIEAPRVEELNIGG